MAEECLTLADDGLRGDSLENIAHVSAKLFLRRLKARHHGSQETFSLGLRCLK